MSIRISIGVMCSAVYININMADVGIVLREEFSGIKVKDFFKGKIE